MRNLCIIPARGGSKRIPRKNIKEFIGKPIISYSIDIALQSNIFDDVIVSTDDEEISQISKYFGAQVPFFRSKENSNDYATTMDVVKEVVFVMEELEKFYDNICIIYPCSPLLNSKLIIEAYQKLIGENFNSIFPIIKYSNPIDRSLEIIGNHIKYRNPEYQNTRSQDLKEAYFDPGQFYWLKRNILNSNTLVNENTGFVILKEIESQDIDNLDDWKMAELKYKLINKFYED